MIFVRDKDGSYASSLQSLQSFLSRASEEAYARRWPFWNGDDEARGRHERLPAAPGPPERSGLRRANTSSMPCFEVAFCRSPLLNDFGLGEERHSREISKQRINRKSPIELHHFSTNKLSRHKYSNHFIQGSLSCLCFP